MSQSRVKALPRCARLRDRVTKRAAEDDRWEHASRSSRSSSRRRAGSRSRRSFQNGRVSSRSQARLTALIMAFSSRRSPPTSRPARPTHDRGRTEPPPPLFAAEGVDQVEHRAGGATGGRRNGSSGGVQRRPGRGSPSERDHHRKEREQRRVGDLLRKPHAVVGEELLAARLRQRRSTRRSRASPGSTARGPTPALSAGGAREKRPTRAVSSGACSRPRRARSRRIVAPMPAGEDEPDRERAGDRDREVRAQLRRHDPSPGRSRRAADRPRP